MLEAALMVALAVPAAADPKIAQLLASEGLALLGRPGEVRVSGVDGSPSSKEAPADAKSVRIRSFRVRPTSHILTPEDAATVRAILRSATSYRGGKMMCMFEPGVAFAFPSRAELEVQVCFKCGEVQFARGSERLGRVVLSATGREGLFSLYQKLSPLLEKEATVE